MAETIPAGVLECWAVPLASLTDPTNPSAAEINAGTRLTTFIQSGPDFPESGSVVDSANMSSKFNATRPGTFGGDQGSMEILRHIATADDTAFTTLTPDTEFYMVVGRHGVGGANGQFASTDRADVYATQVISRSPMPPVRNELEKELVTFAITAPPNRDVAVAV